MSTGDDVRGNAILAQLPGREYRALEPGLRVEDIALRHPAYAPGQAILDVYFPLSAVFSLVAVADERVVVEVATIGREGMVGLPVYLGATSSPQAAFCQVAGRAARLPAAEFRSALRRDGVLRRAMNRFTQATMVQISQSVVCNRSHTTDERAARWLLTTQDRTGRDRFSLTQQFLAQMLGVQRATVSETARRLQSAGLIDYRRGNITITDRDGLLRTSCACYDIVKAEFEQITNPTTE